MDSGAWQGKQSIGKQRVHTIDVNKHIILGHDNPEYSFVYNAFKLHAFNAIK